MISIIIPTYNEEKAVGEALAYLKLGLTIPYEIIVSDDKSTDKTVEIARRYCDTVLCPESKHKTIAQNRNSGACSAKGDMFVFMDADSRIENPNDFFTKALRRFDTDQKLVALTGKELILPELEKKVDRIVYAMINSVHYVKNNILHRGEASGKFQMMRRSAFLAVGGFREDLVSREDGDMFYRLSRIGKTLYDPTLIIFNQGRRAHRIGWPRLLSIWMVDTLWVFLFNKARSKEWIAIR